MTPTDFIHRWKKSGGAELANSQSFLKELCELLDVPQPEPTQPDEAANAYVFEKAVLFNNGDGTTSQGRIDLYRRGSFVLESKQGTERREQEQAEALATTTKQKKFRAGTAERGTPAWELAMTRAREQARRYAQAIPNEWPPFLIVVDVGHCFDLYADFSQSGKNYVPFPDPNSYRLKLDDLAKEDVRDKLRSIWLEPHTLDPAKRAAKVTRELAERLAKLAKSLEGKHPPEEVAQFLMRCLFTMFAEDIELGGIKKGAFARFLEARRGKLDTFVPMLANLWKTMDTGGFSVILEAQLQQFNGGLFEHQTVLPLTADQLELLIEAAQAEWTDVEPAIFGTLLERALDPHERHKLGAHYTPRAYVERLVMPTIIEPLREDWNIAYATAVAQHESGKAKEAIATVRTFHEKLCETRVLDPACGSGNFLYVSLELMKRLEGEVLKALKDFGDNQQVLLTIDPHQFLGIEINPRAAAITDLVLWIGYLQWHFRTRGKNVTIADPIIKKFHNIECRDAVLAWDSVEEVKDENGQPVTRWDGRTTKPHPVTGEEVPDETARVPVLKYIKARKAEWPQMDFVVGNPPFIGNFKMRESLGDGYTETIRRTYDELPESCDYVMYWWHKAADLVRLGKARRFGLISTNSIRQILNRKVIDWHLASTPPLSLYQAIPDHPWVDTADGAAVRISMTIGVLGPCSGTVYEIVSEAVTGADERNLTFAEQHGIIYSTLAIGVNVASAFPLKANEGVSNTGVKLRGAGFIVSRDRAAELGLGKISGIERHLREYRNGRDINQSPRDVMVIDLDGMAAEDVLKKFPEVYQHVFETVKPERDQNNEPYRRENWWLFGRRNTELRSALRGIPRYIATAETSKHRFFTFLSDSVLPDNMLVNIAIADALYLGVISSRIHIVWALATGGTLEDRPRYNKTRCFETFPFPDAQYANVQRIQLLAEQLDAHRKRQQELHPELTMTGMYNVLEKLRSGEELTAKEKKIHEQGLVSVLKQIHDELDAAVFEAYGWPTTLTDEEILERLVALNHERAEEEKRGLIRWLRPEFQNPGGQANVQPTLAATDDEEEVEQPKKNAAKAKKEPWPAALPERMRLVHQALASAGNPLAAKELASRFKGAKADAIDELLATLAAVGQARRLDDGRYAA